MCFTDNVKLKTNSQSDQKSMAPINPTRASSQSLTHSHVHMFSARTKKYRDKFYFLSQPESKKHLARVLPTLQPSTPRRKKSTLGRARISTTAMRTLMFIHIRLVLQELFIRLESLLHLISSFLDTALDPLKVMLKLFHLFLVAVVHRWSLSPRVSRMCL